MGIYRGGITMIIREATLADALSIAKVHIDTWRTTYNGIVSNEYLNGLTYDKKEKVWQNIINDAMKDEKHIFIAEDEEVGVIGFTSCGPEREGENLYKGELYAIYIIKEFQNHGIDKLLFNRVVEKLNEIGIHSMIIWALEGNYSACNFYKSNGGKMVKEKGIKIGDDVFKEVAYGWLNINTLI
jgi:GNAT superfamily N-acetyltransferase